MCVLARLGLDPVRTVADKAKVPISRPARLGFGRLADAADIRDVNEAPRTCSLPALATLQELTACLDEQVDACDAELEARSAHMQTLAAQRLVELRQLKG